MSIDAALGPVESEPEEPKKPGKSEMILLGCLIAVFVLLAAYGLISTGVGPRGGASASRTTSPAVTHGTAASPSSAPLSAAPPIAVAPPASRRDTSPRPAARPAQRSLDVTAIAAFGPDGMWDGDHPDIAYRAIDDGAEPWHTSWYLSPEFGNLKAGSGLLLDMGKSVTVSSVQLILGGEAGAAVQVRVGNTADLADLAVVAAATDVGGTVRLPMAARASGKYVLIWFTTLPPIGQGKYQVSVYDATVDGIAGTYAPRARARLRRANQPRPRSLPPGTRAADWRGPGVMAPGLPGS